VYARQVDDRVLTFQVSGMLWNRSLVMRDLQTGSYWSHLLGRAKAGPLVGEELTIIPSTITDWGRWLESHPDTTAVMLRRSARDFRREMYRHPRRYVIGISGDNRARAWVYHRLILQPVVNDTFDEVPVAVFFDARSGASYIYRRQHEGETLTFYLQEGKLFDRQSGSEWDWLRGEAIAGKLKGARLEPLPGIISFAKAWKDFHPQSTYWQADEQ